MKLPNMLILRFRSNFKKRFLLDKKKEMYTRRILYDLKVKTLFLNIFLK